MVLRRPVNREREARPRADKEVMRSTSRTLTLSLLSLKKQQLA